MKVYDEGTLVESVVQFVDVNGADIDPAAVEFLVDVNGVVTTYQYAGASAPAANTVARISTGMYEFWFDTTGQSGPCAIQSIGTGLGQATTPPVYFYVTKNLAAA